jgi:type IV secretion system protein VirD4
MSAGSLLAAFRYPQVEAGAEDPITAERLFDGEAHTLYIVAAARHQRLLAPLVVGMLSSLLHEAAERARRAGPMRPTLRVLMDEAANIAPLRDLPAHLSQASGHGVRIATIWQSLAQLQDRYRTAADGVLANSAAKVFMGPVTDDRTREFIQGLAGQVPAPSESRTKQWNNAMTSSRTKSIVWRPALSAAELQQLGERVLVIEGASKPAIATAGPWWDDRAFRGRMTSSTGRRS